MIAAAQPGDILTISTVRDLVVGSDIALYVLGTQALKGVEGTWQLFSAVRPSRVPALSRSGWHGRPGGGTPGAGRRCGG